MNTFAYEKGVSFFKDGFVPFGEANLSIASSSVLYGLGIYTVFSAHWDAKEKAPLIFRLRDHYDRLVGSSKIMDFHTFAEKWPFERFEKTMKELLARNKIQENVLVRACVFIDALIAGTKIHGLPNELSAYVYPVGQILPKTGINVCISSWTHNADNAIPSRAKINGGYVNVCLMKNEALQNGYDDALSLDADGHVTEGTVANFFMVRNGTLITPPVSSDMLEGITRGTVLALAKDLGIPTVERSIDRSELYLADEAFISGSSASLIPILSVDKRIVSKGAGPITSRLAESYQDVREGRSTSHAAWLTKA